MIGDVQSTLSNRQAVLASGPSENTYDRGALGTPVNMNAQHYDVGRGTKVPFRLQVVETFAGVTSVQVSVQVDDNVGFASPKTVYQTPAIPVADLKAGYVFAMDQLPLGVDERFTRLFYTVAGGPGSAGRIFAGAVLATEEFNY